MQKNLLEKTPVREKAVDPWGADASLDKNASKKPIKPSGEDLELQSKKVAASLRKTENGVPS